MRKFEDSLRIAGSAWRVEIKMSSLLFLRLIRFRGLGVTSSRWSGNPAAISRLAASAAAGEVDEVTFQAVALAPACWGRFSQGLGFRV